MDDTNTTTPHRLVKGRYDTKVYYGRSPLPEALLTEKLVERWGMIACAFDGEDSAGRQKLRVLTPDELVERAAAVTKAFFARAIAEGWVVDVPIPDDDK